MKDLPLRWTTLLQDAVSIIILFCQGFYMVHHVVIGNKGKNSGQGVFQNGTHLNYS